MICIHLFIILKDILNDVFGITSLNMFGKNFNYVSYKFAKYVWQQLFFCDDFLRRWFLTMILKLLYFYISTTSNIEMQYNFFFICKLLEL